jgi:hypothetical protein
MPVADQTEVRNDLDNFSGRLRSVLDRAMVDWEAMPNKAWLHYPRDRAVIIFSYIARHALVEFNDDPDVYVIAEPQTVKFLFRDSVLLRFKKGNARGVGSNIQTQATLEFIDPQLAFGGLPDVHKVEVVYQLNILGTAYAEVSAVARDRRTRIWAYPLTDRPSAEVIPLPPRVPPTLAPPSVTPKRSADPESADNQPAE